MPDLDWTPYDRAMSEIESVLDDADIVNNRATTSITDQINAVLDNEAPGLLDALIGAVSAAGDLASGLLESLGTGEDLWSSLFNLIADSQDKYGPGVLSFWIRLWEHVLPVIGERYAGNWDGLAGAITRLLQIPAARDDGVRDLVTELHEAGPFVRGFMGAVGAALSMYEFAKATQAGPLSAYTQTSMRAFTPTPLSLAQLTELLKRGEIGEDFAKDHAARSGFSPELFDLAYKIEQQRLSPDHYVRMWLRDPNGGHVSNLEKMGISNDDIQRLLNLAFAEPTPSDIVRFLVRDAYDESAVASGQLDADFDRKYKRDAFDRVGVSEELARLYWRAHWQLPSPTQGYEMLHREQINMDQLRELLKLADYAPAYVDPLINIAYNVPGRIDLRRMWEVGAITDRNELVRRYKHLGYNDADAELLTSFSIAISDRTKQNAAERKRAPIAAQIVRSYMLATLSQQEARDGLISLGFTPEEADYRLREAEYGRERDRGDRIRDAIGRLYTRGQIDEGTARNRLAAYGFSDAESQHLFDSWIIDRELRELTEAERRERDLSRADIVAAFETGLLAPDSAFAALQNIGYDPQESDTILELSLAKTARADAKLEQDAVRAEYIARRIGLDEASARLDAIGTRADRRDALLRRWTIDRENREPDLPIAWIERMILHALIPKEEAEEELRRRGFSDTEVDWALRLWGEEVSVARERLEQQGRLARERLEQQAQIAADRISVQERALQLRERTATTAQILQQERFQQTLEQRERLQTQRLDAAAQARVQTAAVQAERDAKRFAQTREQQANQIAAADARLTRQLEAAAARQEDAQAESRRLREEQNALTLQLQDRQDARQQRTIEASIRRLETQIAAAERKAQAAADLRVQLQATSQQFQREERQAREAADAARRIEQEAARVRQETRGEASQIRREERASARRTIERADAATQAESLRSLQLRRDSLIADLMAQLAALEATAAEERIARAEQQSREAQDTLSRLTGPALTFDPGV